jgi:predicted RNA-binding Zn ribbon-like protein
MSAGTDHDFDLSGGHLGLDFVNTVGGMREVKPNEHLLGYGDLVAFARQTGAIAERVAARLAAEARRRPDEAVRALEAVKAVREALYRVFSDGLGGRAPRRDDLAAVNAALGRALSHRCLAEREGALVLTSCGEDPRDLEAPLWAPLTAAADLLAQPEALARVRVCGLYEDEECSWLFLDKTKARTRRWCCMNGCGNRAKARRHYQRVKDGGEAG